jgi:hypothetical protein
MESGTQWRVTGLENPAVSKITGVRFLRSPLNEFYQKGCVMLFKYASILVFLAFSYFLFTPTKENSMFKSFLLFVAWVASIYLVYFLW